MAHGNVEGFHHFLDNSRLVLDYVVKSESCRYWMHHDYASDEYKKWEEEHKAECKINFDGSADAMEPYTTRFFSHEHSMNVKFA